MEHFLKTEESRTGVEGVEIESTREEGCTDGPMMFPFREGGSGVAYVVGQDSDGQGFGFHGDYQRR